MVVLAQPLSAVGGAVLGRQSTVPESAGAHAERQPLCGGPPRGRCRQAVRRAGLNARELMEVQTAAKLRWMGWQLPPQVSDDYVLRVYDTRLARDWLAALVPDLGLAAMGPVVLVGGDFVLDTDREDGAALRPGRLERWGAPGSGRAMWWSRPGPTWQRGWSVRGCRWPWRRRAPG
jgi:hypothetical protein